MKLLALLLLAPGLVLQIVGLVMTSKESPKHLDSVLSYEATIAVAIINDEPEPDIPAPKPSVRGLTLALSGVILATAGSIVALFPW